MSEQARPIRFVHRGRVVEVPGAETTRTLLDWLREDARCLGTKEGCGEGDCGACTVRVGERVAGGVRWRTVNACITLLPMVDGRAVQTIEDVKQPDGALHPAQQALVDCHGSQCGFCTPGFVMSLVQVYERDAGHRPPSRQQLADDLSGNLCRCTGYRPILDAGQRMFEAPRPARDEASTQAALDALAGDPPLAYVDRAGARCFAPRTVDALAALCQQHPDARLLAGATDIGLWVNKQHRALPLLVSTGRVAEMRRIDALPDGGLRIGAAVSLEDAWAALAQRHPELREMGLRFASPPVRHAGTLGGNVANGSPIGDGAPVLMALDATLVLRRGARERRLALAAFYLDYMRNALEPGEFVQAIEIPPPAFTALRAYKLSKRFDSDISGVSAAFALTLDGDDRVRDVRLAFGGLAAVVKRAAQAEAALRGQAWSEASVEAAAVALARDFTPLTDLRASAAYRARVAGNLLRRFWLETRLRASLSVFARPGTATSSVRTDGLARSG